MAIACRKTKTQKTKNNILYFISLDGPRPTRSIDECGSSTTVKLQLLTRDFWDFWKGQTSRLVWFVDRKIIWPCWRWFFCFVFREKKIVTRNPSKLDVSHGLDYYRCTNHQSIYFLLFVAAFLAESNKIIHCRKSHKFTSCRSAGNENENEHQ